MKEDVRTVARLLSLYDTLPRDVKFVSLLLIRHCKPKSAIGLCMREIRSPDGLLAGAAAGALSAIGGANVFARLRKMVLAGSFPRIGRINALDALSRIENVDDVPLLIDTFLHVCRMSQDSQLICIATNGFLNFVPKLHAAPSLRDEVVQGLSACLDSSDAEIQACAVLTLGELAQPIHGGSALTVDELRKSQCLDKLETLATSGRGAVPGWGPVKRIAQKALAKIGGRSP